MQSLERRRQQYELEKSLREEILSSSRQNRCSIVASVYAKLFSAFPDHSVFEIALEERLQKGKLSAGLIAPLLPESAKVLEVGCGRGDTLMVLKSMGYNCIGIEASSHMLNMHNSDLDVQFGTADKLNFDNDIFDAVFCQEVLEHLHPDDVPLFFQESFRVLKSGGILSVETPNKTTGPQDISRGFSTIAQGLHLKEWTVSELNEQFLLAGFRNIKSILSPQFLARRYSFVHRLTKVPIQFKHFQDIILRFIPNLSLRTFIGKCIGLDDIYLFGKKP
jgi:2-polyprenyl-3-methyl-5-hydroxy-6-metoxy-1,4-benzoquinol methylase